LNFKQKNGIGCCPTPLLIFAFLKNKPQVAALTNLQCPLRARSGDRLRGGGWFKDVQYPDYMAILKGLQLKNFGVKSRPLVHGSCPRHFSFQCLTPLFSLMFSNQV